MDKEIIMQELTMNELNQVSGGQPMEVRVCYEEFCVEFDVEWQDFVDAYNAVGDAVGDLWDWIFG